LPSPYGDGRYLFVVPWQGVFLLGPTDTPYSGDPDTIDVDESDLSYILDAANLLFPDLRLTPADIISTIAGLRPLIAADAETTSKLSREHEIWESESGLISIAGGKLTTYRTMAIEVVDLVLRRLGRGGIPSRTAEIPLGADRSARMEELVQAHPDLRGSLGAGLPYTRGDVAYAALEEMAVMPEDFLSRRTPISIKEPDQGAAVRGEVAQLLERFVE
jgi:glycerol-3-phosphate dehydrogenase